jgi:uncharacterized protein
MRIGMQGAYGITMPEPLDPARIERPDPVLMRYYLFVSLLSGPAFPLVLLPLWMRYVTLRYRFDEEGISMKWGIVFRREINLTYRRIQDIHLTANILQRWLGLAKISLQTASGNAMAEMTIEGVLQPEVLRDHLYARMRGARDERLGSRTAPPNSPAESRQVHSGNTGLIAAGGQAAGGQAAGGQAAGMDGEASLEVLRDIRDALQVLVERAEAQR